ncbi:MurR/RpiR family transcriptional regulator [Roseovarius sp. 2305UL8-3]|uniref:MurR/RpiR family transcriptional regulator n=1 Tax=Roseovarius conchicola TaxID=3121636 RepID=UPI003528EC4F
MTDIDQVISALVKSRGAMGKQLRRAADYVLENPDRVATQSMRRLAADAGVTAPTMSRVAKTVGFSSYEDFRNLYRNGYHQIAHNFGDRALKLQGLHGESDGHMLWQSLLEANNAHLQLLLEGTRGLQIEKAASAILSARRVFVTGMQSSFAFATYLHYIGGLAFPNWTLISGRGSTLADETSALSDKDVVIVISFAPYARDAVRLAELAVQRGASVIAITDELTSPLAALADDLFVVPSDSPQYFSSYVATTALIEALVANLVSQSGEEVVDRIKNIEATRETFSDYWSEDN